VATRDIVPLGGVFLFGKMRRTDREVKDQDEIVRIIDDCQVLVLGLADGDFPHLIPLNFASSWENESLVLYFHSAAQGRKIELLQNNSACSFMLYRDLGIKRTTDSATNYYESIMGTGEIECLVDEAKKSKAANKLLEKCKMLDLSPVPEKALEKTFFGRIWVKSISAKANREVEK
jgi:nitroimidazol reductase NimA-like FMN-containing flavoprotein (pyridoxamine 5'-phosphate oxidase superfamily)